MMIGEVLRRHHPTVQIPNWEPYELDQLPSQYTTAFSPPSSNSGAHYYNTTIPIPTSTIHHHHHPDYSLSIPSPSQSQIPASDYSPSSIAADYAAALHHRYSPSSPHSSDTDTNTNSHDYDSFPSDSFRIYEFKVRRCVRGRSHDWTECPFAHPGEKARRRDPRKFHYSGTPCPDFRKGACRKGDNCEYAHGVFECWLHPQRYRTKPCKDGIHCSRRVCFFAHTPDQLRVFPDNENNDDDDSEKFLFPTDLSSPPPISSPEYGGFESVSELVGCMSGLHLQHVGNGAVASPRRCWGYQFNGGGGGSVAGFGTPQAGCGLGSSLPSTPTQTGPVRGLFDYDTTPTGWTSNLSSFEEEEPVMEQVESGRDIRARMYAKLRSDNSLDRPESPFCPAPDFGWVSELVK